MRKTVLFVVSVALAMVLACGVALAAEIIRCPTGENGRCEGTAEADVMLGTDFADTMFGYDGNDRMEGKDGDDEMHGGPGNERWGTWHFMSGGRGDDTMYGDSGSDELFGDLQQFAEELICRKASRFCSLVGNQTPDV